MKIDIELIGELSRVSTDHAFQLMKIADKYGHDRREVLLKQAMLYTQLVTDVDITKLDLTEEH